MDTQLTPSHQHVLADKERLTILHSSDLHLGKRVHGYSLRFEQECMLSNLLQLMDEHEADILVLAGDIYDSKQPPLWAIHALSDFLVKIAEQGKQLVMIGGNHDPLDQLNFCSELLHDQGIHIYSVLSEQPHRLSFGLGDAQEPLLTLWPIPFMRAQSLRSYFPDEPIDSANQAMKHYIERIYADELFCQSRMNIACAHQFVVAFSTHEPEIPELSDSERSCLGTLDAINAALFSRFDYVALGHIHKAQRMSEQLYYSGSPLVYSFSEAAYNKSLMKISLSSVQPQVRLERIDIPQPREWKELRGNYRQFMDISYAENYQESYVRLILEDEVELLNGYERLRTRYPYLMQIEYEVAARQSKRQLSRQNFEHMQQLSPFELFDQFYREQQNRSMNERQRSLVREIFHELEGSGNNGAYRQGE